MATGDRRLRDRLQRAQSIITAARQLAEREGWEAVTTRRLSEAIEYSQPVLYTHFPNGKSEIADAVALEGFGELAAAIRTSRGRARTARARVTRMIDAYLDFAEANPAVYQAMFSGPTRLVFGADETPDVLRSGFAEIMESTASAAGAADRETYAEVVWSALHGLATLARDGRLRAEARAHRTRLLVDELVRQ